MYSKFQLKAIDCVNLNEEIIVVGIQFGMKRRAKFSLFILFIAKPHPNRGIVFPY